MSTPDRDDDWFGTEPELPSVPTPAFAPAAVNGHTRNLTINGVRLPSMQLSRTGTASLASPPAADPLAPQTHSAHRLAGPPPPDAASAAFEVDFDTVTELQDLVAERVLAAMKTMGRESRTRADERRMELTRSIAAEVVAEHIDNARAGGDRGLIDRPDYAPSMVAAVVAFLTGLGRLQPLIEDPDVENIWVKGTQVRVVYADGRVDTSHRAAGSDEELVKLLQQAAATAGTTERALSSARPILHLRLRDGSRMTVIIDVTEHPVVAIRRHRVMQASLDDMVRMQSVTPSLRDFLKAALAARLNIMVAGMPNAGKTTLLRALADEIPADEVFAYLETVGELGFEHTGRHPWAFGFEERTGHGERDAAGRPEGQLTVNDLFPHMLRLSTTRIIVGEVREQEVVAMFDAMTTTPGSLCTIHARHPGAVIDRLAELLMRYGASRSREGAYLTISNALDFIVFVTMEEWPGHPPRRYVSHVIEASGMGEGGRIATSQLFSPGPQYGLAEPTGIRPLEWRVDRLQRVGYNVAGLLQARAPLDRGH